MKKLLKKAEELWKSVFKEDVYTNIDGDDIQVGHYAISPKEIEIERVSILGRKKEKVQGFELSVFIDTPGSHLEPPDVDELFVSESERFNYILRDMLEYEARSRIRIEIDDYSTREMYEEMELNDAN